MAPATGEALTALAALWGLPPWPGLPSLTPSDLPQRAGHTIALGAGHRLRTSGGLDVTLPASDPERKALMVRLEAWAHSLLSEAYRGADKASPGWALGVYYGVRPLLPRRLQLWLRRWHARGREARAFLGWPIDGMFVALAEAYLAIQIELEPSRMLHVARRWPPGYHGAVALTHDVEGSVGQERCRKVMALESERGFRSSFNFVAERYSLDLGLMDEMRAAGFEIGSHGIRHDGRKFSSRAVFEARLRLLKEYRDAWKAVGFRSPATHRRWEWMPDLPFDYDSSYPDTDPFEPIPGGCGSPWPFHLGSLVELPITMPQDHTLWEVLQRPALPIWRRKAQWLRDCSGLINIIVHPDYLTTEARWRDYIEFLDDIRAATDLWIALPRDIAQWWRQRAAHRERVELTMEGPECRLAFSADS